MKNFYESAAELDLLGALESPTASDCGKLDALIQDDNDLAYYFFNENRNPAWLVLHCLLRSWGKETRFLPDCWQNV